MAETEQIVTNRKTMKELVEFMEEAVKEGLTAEEITSQVDLLLHESAKGRLEKSLKEVRKGDLKGSKDPQALLRTLHDS